MEEKKIMVSVFCLTYNHEKYIRNALEGLVKQKTIFPFEVLVHDDASTDKTPQIIKEYEEKYPHIIKPIYQEINQYSKGTGIIRPFLLPRASGKYFAWCEGDDCWISENKLQKQVEFLETHSDYSACAHKVKVIKNVNAQYDLSDIDYIPQITTDQDYNAPDIITNRVWFQTSSFMMRSELYRSIPDCFRLRGAGDYQLFMYSAFNGKVHCFSDVMSLYNYGVDGSWTIRVGKDKEKQINHAKALIKMLDNVDQYYNHQYSKPIQKKIVEQKRLLYSLTGDKEILLDHRVLISYLLSHVVHKYLPFILVWRKKLKNWLKP